MRFSSPKSRAATAAALLFSLTAGQSIAGNQPYGAGKAGAGGFVPILSAGSPNVGNTAFELRADRVLGGSVSVFLMSLTPGMVPFGGGNILVDLGAPNPLLVLPLATQGPFGVAGKGFTTLPLPLPNLPQMPGLSVYAQVLVDQISGGVPGYALSQGLRIQFAEEPVVFLGTSIAGGADPYNLIDKSSGVIIDSGSTSHTDNVTSAAWAGDGSSLFVASGLQDTISIGDTSVNPVQFQTIYTSAGNGCYGVDVDNENGLLWTLTDPGTGSRELVAIDGNPGSPSLGAKIFQTSGLAAGALIEPWALSPSGRYAMVLSILPASIYLIDTDPNSLTFLQTLDTQVLPTSGAAFTLGNAVSFTPDDEFAVIMVQNAGTPSEVARYHIPTQSFWDHHPTQPGVQHIGLNSQPSLTLFGAGTHIEIASSGQFAVIGGFGDCGWMGRLDFDLTAPAFFKSTPWSQGNGLSNSWRFDMNADDSEIAVASWPANGCSHVLSTPAVSFIDVSTGAVTSSISIPFNSNSPANQNLYTIKIRE